MTNEPEGRDAEATTATTDATGDAATTDAAGDAAAEAGSVETATAAATHATLTEPAATTHAPLTEPAAATQATIHTAAPAAEAALDTTTITPSPPPQHDAVPVADSLEAIKTAIVWLVVIQLLTILSPLLRVSLKWSLIVGLALTLGSFAVGVLAYLKAQRAQRTLPD